MMTITNVSSLSVQSMFSLADAYVFFEDVKSAGVLVADIFSDPSRVAAFHTCSAISNLQKYSHSHLSGLSGSNQGYQY
jgi:hypothetical protein